MATSAELQLLRTLQPGVAIPGVDGAAGNPLSTSQLKSYTTLTTNPKASVYYSAAEKAVIVKGDDVALNGYNFSGADVMVWGNNATIENCTFDDKGSGYDDIVQESPASGMTVENCTFDGGDAVPLANFVTSVSGYATIENNNFLDAPMHAIQISDGVISGNSISGGGYEPGAHADAINVAATTGPVVISDNYIDWTATDNPGTLVFAIRIATDGGNTSNVTVTDNILLGGQETVFARPTRISSLAPGAAGTIGATGTMTNVNIRDNSIGLAVYGAFYPLGAGVTASNNTIFDFTNPIWSRDAWSAYQANGLGAANLIMSTANTTTAPASGATTLYGGGLSGVHLDGSTGETVFVGRAGTDDMVGGPAANIFKFLTIADSYRNTTEDAISNFDPLKDVIDLSAIDADSGLYSTAPAASFTFIGTAPFSGSGGQVRYQYDPGLNETLVQADLNGDSTADLEIRLAGDINLTAANFALTAAQSAADLANGAALRVATARFGAGAEYTETNVRGQSYSSFQALYPNMTTDVADNLNLSASANQLDLYGSNLTIARAAGTESATSGSVILPLAYKTSETVQIGTAGSETFVLGAKFGAETLDGFATAGANADVIQFARSSFSYLTAGMTQAQDLAAVLAHASSGAFGTTIIDSAGDRLTLEGMTPAMITAGAADFRFV